MDTRKDFESFLDEFLALISPNRFKAYFREFAENYYDHAILSEDFKEIEYTERNLETGEFESGKLDIDKYLYRWAAVYFNNSAIRITKEIDSISELERFLNMLRTALNKIEADEFYSDFPYYRGAIIKLGNAFKEIEEVFDKPLKSNKGKKDEFGEKKLKALELKKYLKIIKNSEGHNEAVQKIKEKYSEFSYPDPNLELFTYNDNKLVEKRACKALEEIGKIKWGDAGPGWEYIKKILF